jgi:Flp pilus assembly pilin Flp
MGSVEPKKFAKNKSGAASVHYAWIAAGLLIAIITAMQGIASKFQATSSILNGLN